MWPNTKRAVETISGLSAIRKDMKTTPDFGV
jgi:hypothetical protein